MAGVAPRFQTYTGTDPLGDVVSWNLKRRHLSTSQRGKLSVELKPMFEEQAKKRQRDGQERGRNTQKGIRANLPETEKARAREQAADATGVSDRLVEDAEYVKENAPDVFEKIGTKTEAGRMTVNAAKQEVKRRQLSTSQRTKLAVTLKPAFEEQARERQKQAEGKPRGEKSVSADLREQSHGKASEKAAEAVA